MSEEKAILLEEKATAIEKTTHGSCKLHSVQLVGLVLSVCKNRRINLHTERTLESEYVWNLK